MHYLITGSSGQLARAFQARFDALGIDYSAPGEADLDITDFETVREAVQALKPDIILNCAAYNDVERAELEPALAFAVNARAVQNLVRACAETKVQLVHYGTDYIFDGTKEGLYTEDDRPNPLNKYGESKLEGERAIMDCESLIMDRGSYNPRPTTHTLTFRTSWVYGDGTQNFLHKLRQWSQKQEVLKIVWDQISIPTYTNDIVACTLKALDAGLCGIYHLTNSGYASRYEVARCFLDMAGIDKLVLPVSSSHFGSTVNRPFFSAMSNSRLSGKLDTDIPTWKDALRRYVGHGG